MQENDLVKCPLCSGQGELQRSELLAALNDKGLLDRLHQTLDTLVPVAESPMGTAMGATKPRDFQKDVHTWNPTLPMWTRSPKE